MLALDTEFERRNTFYARLALIQIHDGERAWLVDPLAVTDLSPLAQLLEHYRGELVMHAPLEDLEVLQHTVGSMPIRVFDTQLAAALGGLGAGLGYDRLVNALFDVEVSKSATRSDWLRRPLSDEQLDYAIADTVHLLPAYRVLTERLDTLERRDWLDEEVVRLKQRVNTPEAGRDFLRLVRRVADDDHTRGRLLAMCRWREALARERDLPRRRLAEDNLLVACVVHAPSDLQALRALPDFRQLKRRIGDSALLDAITSAAGASPVPRPPQAEDLRALKAPMSRLRATLRGLSTTLDLPAEVVAPKRLLELLLVSRLVRNEPAPEEFMGWRRDTVLPALLAAIDSA